MPDEARQHLLPGKDAADEIAEIERADLLRTDAGIAECLVARRDGEGFERRLLVLAEGGGADADDRDRAHFAFPQRVDDE